MSPSLTQSKLSLVSPTKSTGRSRAILPLILVTLLLAACEMRLQIPSSSNGHDLPAYEFEASGEDFLISALDEVHSIADWSSSFTSGLGARISDIDATGQKREAVVTGTDTVYIYGQVIPGGYGAVVTERYARPKGLLLITVRKTYGKANGRIVTETKRYASYADHLADNPQQTNVTEIYGAQTDTIVTRVVRNGTLQTYTFRLPVITRVVNPQDGSIRTTSRYASNGEIVSKTTDGDNNLVQLRRTCGQSDGSTVSRTEYPDGSWRQVRALGQADGKVLRETTSGLPTIGSGIGPPPSNVPRPNESRWAQTCQANHLRASTPQRIASGMSTPGTTPRPTPNCKREAERMGANKSPASGNQAVPVPPIRPSVPRRDLSDRALSGPVSHHSFSSGATVTPIQPRPVLASGITMMPPRPPRPALASGVGVSPTPPRPILASGVTVVPKPPVLKFASGVTSIPKPPIPRSGEGTEVCLLCSGMQATPPRSPRPILT